MKDQKFENKIFKKWKKDFSESEVIQSLIEKVKNQNIIIGKLKSDISELKDQNKMLEIQNQSYKDLVSKWKDWDIKVDKEIIRENKYQQIKKQKNYFETRCNELKKINSDLASKLCSINRVREVANER